MVQESIDAEKNKSLKRFTDLKENYIANKILELRNKLNDDVRGLTKSLD
jgi:hypothetical protein